MWKFRLVGPIAAALVGGKRPSHIVQDVARGPLSEYLKQVRDCRVRSLTGCFAGSVAMSGAGHVELACDLPAPLGRELETVADSAPDSEGKSESPFPLNSRRLTGPYLKSIAKAIGLPTTGSVDETRVMIDGKLEEMGRDSRNVQVILTKDSGPRALSPEGC